MGREAMASLKGKDILHGNQFSKKEIDAIIKIAAQIEKELKRKEFSESIKGKDPRHSFL